MGGLDSCDPVMLDLFRAEMDAHLPALSQGLLALEKGKADETDIEAMMRAAHSIKGAARIVGVEAAVRVSHAMEDCFIAAQGRRLTLSSEGVDVLLQGVDALQRICSPEPGPDLSEQSIESLLERITAVREGKPTAPPISATPVRPPPESKVSVIDVQFATSSRRGSPKSVMESPESCLVLTAVLDDGAAQSLRVDLSEILHRKPRHLRLDFTKVQHIGAAALSLLAFFVREIGHNEPAIILDTQGVSAPMAVLLRITGLDRTYRRGD